jgi:hypothetical protein
MFKDGGETVNQENASSEAYGRITLARAGAGREERDKIRRDTLRQPSGERPRVQRLKQRGPQTTAEMLKPRTEEDRTPTVEQVAGRMGIGVGHLKRPIRLAYPRDGSVANRRP